MDVASAILVLQLQVEDDETILAASDRREDFHAALALHLFDLRERLQVLQDHAVAYGPLGALGQETLDGLFGPYHTPLPIHEQPEPPPSRPPHQSHEMETRQFANLGHQPEVHDYTDPPASTASSPIHNSKRMTEKVSDHEEVNFSKRRSFDEDAREAMSIEANIQSHNTPVVEDDPKKASNIESQLQPSASTESPQNAAETQVIIEVPAGSACIACLAIFAEDSLIQSPCDHKYCAQCLTEHFKASLQGSAFPPSCCYEEIPYDLVQRHLSINLQANYMRKKHAIDNPGTIYCAILSCQALIAPQSISNGRATCVCKAITCAVCKFIAHDDACPEDAERAALLRLAVSQGLRACYRCGELYERDFGCNHMKCTKCSAEFCYNCGRKWRTCTCGTFENQAGQLIRTGEVVDNRAVLAPPQPVARIGVRALSPEYRRYDCGHEEGWYKIIRPDAECHECGYDSGYFLLQCSECNIYSCVRCLFDDE